MKKRGFWRATFELRELRLQGKDKLLLRINHDMSKEVVARSYAKVKSKGTIEVFYSS